MFYTIFSLYMNYLFQNNDNFPIIFMVTPFFFYLRQVNYFHKTGLKASREIKRPKPQIISVKITLRILRNRLIQNIAQIFFTESLFWSFLLNPSELKLHKCTMNIWPITMLSFSSIGSAVYREHTDIDLKYFIRICGRQWKKFNENRFSKYYKIEVW